MKCTRCGQETPGGFTCPTETHCIQAAARRIGELEKALTDVDRKLYYKKKFDKANKDLKAALMALSDERTRTADLRSRLARLRGRIQDLRESMEATDGD